MPWGRDVLLIPTTLLTISVAILPPQPARAPAMMAGATTPGNALAAASTVVTTA